MPFGAVLIAYILLPMLIFGGAQYYICGRKIVTSHFFKSLPVIASAALTILPIAVILAEFFVGDIVSNAVLNAFAAAGAGACGLVGCMLAMLAARIFGRKTK